jgi:hypothetical protein
VGAAWVISPDRLQPIPIIRPTKFVLAINLKTAKALDLTIPPDVLALADEVIDRRREFIAGVGSAAHGRTRRGAGAANPTDRVS